MAKNRKANACQCGERTKSMPGYTRGRLALPKPVLGVLAGVPINPRPTQ